MPQPAAFLTGPDASAVLGVLQEVLTSQGYRITPDESGWAGRAEVGSKSARVFAGGFARRMILDYALTQSEHPGTLRLVITPASSGWSGGAIGASKADTEMTNVSSQVHMWLAQRGLLVG